MGGLQQRARLLAAPLGEALFAVTTTGLTDHVLSNVREGDDAPAETAPGAVWYLKGEDPHARLRGRPPARLGLHQRLGHLLRDGRAALLVVLALGNSADEPVVRQLGRSAGNVGLMTMHEHPGERADLVVGRIGALVLDQQVGAGAEQLPLGLRRESALGDVCVEHRHVWPPWVRPREATIIHTYM